MPISPWMSIFAKNLRQCSKYIGIFGPEDVGPQSQGVVSCTKGVNYELDTIHVMTLGGRVLLG